MGFPQRAHITRREDRAVLETQSSGEAPIPPASAAAAAVDPLEDPQTDAQYRRELVETMVYRALTQAFPQRAQA